MQHLPIAAVHPLNSILLDTRCPYATVIVMAFPRKEGLAVEVIRFNGYTYRRYPESTNAAHRRYFSRTGHRLHRDVWEHFKGPIPKGWEIHHKDDNYSNNDIANLECLPRKKHRAKHHVGYVERGRSARQLAHLAKAGEAAKAWHRSAEGRAWHRANAARTIHAANAPKPYSKTKKRRLQCAYCGKSFWSKHSRASWCSSRCQSRASRQRRRAVL